MQINHFESDSQDEEILPNATTNIPHAEERSAEARLEARDAAMQPIPGVS
jgi:hypothetical protein